MIIVRGIPLVALVGIVAASCSHAPRLATAPAMRDDFRVEYLRNNPDGKHNRHIKNGEITRGMSVIEVLASWGLPNVKRTGKVERNEYWTYYSHDKHTDTYTSYALVFQTRILARWVIETGINSYDALVQRDLIGIPSQGRTQPTEGVSGSINEGGAIKKKPY